MFVFYFIGYIPLWDSLMVTFLFIVVYRFAQEGKLFCRGRLCLLSMLFGTSCQSGQTCFNCHQYIFQFKVLKHSTYSTSKKPHPITPNPFVLEVSWEGQLWKFVFGACRAQIKPTTNTGVSYDFFSSIRFHIIRAMKVSSFAFFSAMLATFIHA